MLRVQIRLPRHFKFAICSAIDIVYRYKQKSAVCQIEYRNAETFSLIVKNVFKK